MGGGGGGVFCFQAGALQPRGLLLPWLEEKGTAVRSDGERNARATTAVQRNIFI